VASSPPGVSWSGWKRSAFAKPREDQKAGWRGTPTPSIAGPARSLRDMLHGQRPGAATRRSPRPDHWRPRPAQAQREGRIAPSRRKSHAGHAAAVEDPGNPLSRIIGVAGGECLRIPIQPVTVQRNGRDPRGRRRSSAGRCMSLCGASRRSQPEGARTQAGSSVRTRTRSSVVRSAGTSTALWRPFPAPRRGASAGR
jgi:hypothetical protein